MDPRHADLETKVASLKKALAASKSAQEIFEAAEATALALEFRGTDAMIGLSPVSSGLLERAQSLVEQARDRAVEGGVPEACLQAAEAIWFARDAKRAKRAVELASRAEGEPRAQHLLGLFAFHGFGRKKDLAESLALHRRAATAGHSDAMFEVYAMMSQGLGCAADPAGAVPWCERAASAGNPRAMANLGGFHATGGGGLAFDEEKARFWYDAAARAGHGRAAATLGVMYALGTGAPRSVADATRYFALADEMGFDWRAFAEAAGVDLGDLLRVTLAPPPRASKAGKLPPIPKLPGAPRVPNLEGATAMPAATPKQAAPAKKKAP
ncbi:MAG: sel1 repeat family protein, partial [Polyangiaceae bacterium]|nr:sel1 repeat family protein [Polyangiaceae bacterium]